MGTTQTPRHVVIGTDIFKVDEEADVPFRRISDSVMVPRADISGSPGAVNLQRDVWLWGMEDFRGGEGRVWFDSNDPLGPPCFYKTEGGIDVRKPGEFSLHPDEQIIVNQTGGGSVPTVTRWTNTDFNTVAGTPEYSAGVAGTHVRLEVGDEVRAPARTPTAGQTIVVHARFVQTKAREGNKNVTVGLEIWNNTGSTTVTSASMNLKDEEKGTLSCSFTAAGSTTYHYRVANDDPGTNVSVDVKWIQEESYGTAPASSQDIRDLRIGINEDVWALAYDGTNTDVLRWNFSTSTWDQIVGNMVASAPRGLTGSDSYMYSLHANGRIYRINGSGATHYATLFTGSGSYGEPLGLAVAANKLYVLSSQSLHEMTLDLTTSLPRIAADNDFRQVVTPGEFFNELVPNTDLRQRITSISNGVRWFTNVAGEQATIYEFGTGGSATPTHFLPLGYKVTAIKHYANTTFIAAQFTNKAATPAETHAGLFFISSDNLLRFLGYFRYYDTNSQPVQYITAYGHDVFFLQGRRIYRYNTGAGGITLENEVSSYDESKSRAMARMDKKFWVAVEGEGTFVADDSYPTTTSWLESPIWDFDVPDLDKVLLSFEIVLKPLPANTQVDVEYKMDEADTWTSAGSITTDGITKQRLAVSDATTTYKFRTLKWRLGLTSLDGTDTPRIRTMNARVYVLDYEESFDMTLLLEDDDSTNRLLGEQRSGRAKANLLWAYKTNKQLVSFQDHYSASRPGDFDTYTVVVEDPFQEITSKGQSSVRLKLKVVS